ncbi:spermatogenesis-associated serine-rich protein 1 [Lethenteron reissneri]|uniref:spermatogenesis-associated serine-rich protein 1 n=1 Tax=Lethenteron reissneri TaxID=7753 RepID=UPI002AB7D165|nr:spermatogenesis-associated serine-rich protein 1 [Lethenteron reissneri]
MELGLRSYTQYRNASSRPAKFILFPEEVSFIRHFPQANRNTHTEWGFYDPRGLDKVCYVGKRCLPYQCSGTETASAGRNGVPVVSAGDKAYRAVEYSAGFHLLGSTRAPPRFSAGAKHAADTFIPLQPPPSVPRTPYRKKAQEMQRALEMMEVQALDKWEPPSRASHRRLDGDRD